MRKSRHLKISRGSSRARSLSEVDESPNNAAIGLVWPDEFDYQVWDKPPQLARKISRREEDLDVHSNHGSPSREDQQAHLGSKFEPSINTPSTTYPSPSGSAGLRTMRMGVESAPPTLKASRRSSLVQTRIGPRRLSVNCPPPPSLASVTPSSSVSSFEEVVSRGQRHRREVVWGKGVDEGELYGQLLMHAKGVRKRKRNSQHLRHKEQEERKEYEEYIQSSGQKFFETVLILVSTALGWTMLVINILQWQKFPFHRHPLIISAVCVIPILCLVIFVVLLDQMDQKIVEDGISSVLEVNGHVNDKNKGKDIVVVDDDAVKKSTGDHSSLSVQKDINL